MILLNQLPAVLAIVSIPWSGAWRIDLDVDLDASGVLPSGPALVTIGTTTLTGTIDPRASGKYGTTAKVRVIGGGGGWDKDVPDRHFHNDAGLPSAQIIAATAAEVGEVAIVAALAAVVVALLGLALFVMGSGQ
jgi:hypothetical protein